MSFFEIKQNTKVTEKKPNNYTQAMQKMGQKLRGILIYIISAAVIGVGIFIFYFYFTQGSQAAWFNDEFHYRQQFTFTHNADIAAERAITFSLDTAEFITAGVMQSDCDDTRFTDVNGTPLRYQLTGSCNNAATTYEVVFSKINNGTNIGYVYYGNPSAVSASVDVSAVTALTPSGGDPAITTRTNEIKGPSPVLYWKFNDGTGTTPQDTTSQNNDGSLSGATWEPGGVSANKGEFSLKFDGSNDFVSKSYSSDTELNPGTANMTVSAWFRHSSTISGTDVLISRYNAGGYEVYMKSTGVVCFGLDDSGASFSAVDEACSTSSYADSKWHFVEGVKNGTSSLTIYIDGRSVGTDSSLTVTGSISGSSPTFYVGIDSDGASNPWTGFIDDVKVFTNEQSVRSASQVKADYIARSSAEGNSVILGQDTSSVNLTSGLVGHWKLDENTGTSTADSSGNGFTGTLTNSPAWSPTGKYGSGVTFANSTNHITAGDQTPLELTTFTLSSWFYRTGTCGTFTQCSLISKGNNSNIGYSLNVNDDDGSYKAGLYLNDTLQRVNGTSTISTNQWYHIAATIDGTTIKIYVNGVLETSTAQTVTPTYGNESFKIGNANANNDLPGEGTLDNIRVYNRALSGGEIQQLYNFSPGPVGWWKMDENTGQNLFDSSGNGNSGTVGDNTSVASDDPIWAPGKFGSSLQFDGVDDIADTVTAATLGIDDGDKSFSIMLWVKTSDTSNEEYLFDNCNNCGTNISLRMDTGKFETFISDGTNNNGNPQYGSASQFNDNKWHHFALTWNDGTEKVYGDGILLGTTSATSVTGSLETSNAFRLAARPGTAAFLNGNLDDIRVYNYDRSPAQIIEDMNADHPAPGSPVGSPLGHWKFEEGYGDTANNSGSTGTTNNGNMAGGTTCPQSGDSACPSWTSSGKFGKALDFETSATTDDYIDAGDMNGIDGVSELSYTAWVKFESLSDYQSIISKRNSGVNKSTIGLSGTSEGGNNDLEVMVDNGGTADFGYTTGNIIAVDTWYHVAMVFNGTASGNANILKLYLNGKPQTLTFSGTIPSTSANTANSVYLGASEGVSTTHLDGIIDEAKVYNIALTPEQVKVDYNRGQAVVYGALSTTSSGTVPSDSYSRENCVPWDTTTCNPPVADWKMEEGTGTTINDSSGNGNVSSTFTGNVAWGQGKFGKGLTFDNNDDVVRIVESSSIDLGAGSYSISVWFKTTDTDTTNALVAKHSTTTGAFPFRLSTGSTGFCGFSIGDGTNTGSSTGTTTVNDNKWHQCVAVRDVSGDRTYMYVDGMLEDFDTDPTSGSLANNDDVSIGNSRTGYLNDDFLGDIDGVRIYDYALNASQVAWQYDQGKPMGWWKFDECQGTTAGDSSGKGINGTITPGSGTHTSVGTCGSGSASEMWDDGETGKRNYSLDFDGSNTPNGDYVTMGDVELYDFNGEDFSLAGWFNRETFTTDDVLIGKRVSDVDGAQGYLAWIDDSTDTVTFEVCDANAACDQYSIESTSTFTSTGWNHFVIVWDNDSESGTTIYINGRQENVTRTGTFANIGGDFRNPRNLSIGASHVGGTSNGFAGELDDMMIFNYVLSAKQVNQLYQTQGNSVRFGPATGAP